MILLVCLADLVLLALFFGVRGTGLTRFDHLILDRLYGLAVDQGRGPKPAFSPQVVYLTITDSTYDAFGKNHLDRGDLARTVRALGQMEPAAVAFDIIFARAGTKASDRAFARALEDLGTAWLPCGLRLAEAPDAGSGAGSGAGSPGIPELERLPGLGKRLIRGAKETGNPAPYTATGILTQQPQFAGAAAGSGHISVLPDPDGVFRRLPLLVRTGSGLFPTLGFALFLDWAGISPSSIHVAWGEAVKITAGPDNDLEQDLEIPIDRQGRVYLPFTHRPGRDFKEMPAHTLLASFEDPGLHGNLLDFFEGNMVLVADTAVGTSDLGDTPLGSNVPLVTLHAALVNGLLTRTFYRPWPPEQTMAVLGLVLLLLAAAALLKSPWFLYGTGLITVSGLLWLTWSLFTRFFFFPGATLILATLFVFASLVVCLEAATARDRTFIKKTFARYLPGQVVARLLDNPELLTLGGEEREATVLFADIAGFTSLSESLAPKELVGLLNQYFTAMTDVIQAHGGIIDKYIGDAIMAEFGVPLETPDHADQAVAAALAMQERLEQLQTDWETRCLPRVDCRIGINTNTMVVGNIGSDRVFDYTVLGDAVNLASRLEGANKGYGTRLMISQDTLDRLTPGGFRTRLLDFVIVKGKTRPVKIYEVLGKGEPALPAQSPDAGYYRAYETAFAQYLDRDFPGALEGFTRALSFRPGDLAATRLIARINDLSDPKAGALPQDWNGAVQLTEK